jgi:transcription factor SFP1
MSLKYLSTLLTLLSIIMQGTSPFAYQSPSFHSSSYLPKLEANFMRDFSCCGLTLPSLHELLQHYEEHHAQQVSTSTQKQTSNQSAPPDSKAAIAAGAAAAVQERARQQPQQIDTSKAHHVSPTMQRSTMPIASRNAQQYPVASYPQTQALPTQDMDAVQDMEMDDEVTTPISNLKQTQYPLQDQPRMMQRSQFGQPASARVPPLNLNTLSMGNPLQTHQGLRNSQPSTPISAGRSGGMFQNNPTVSSVNTPTLSTHPLSQQQQYMNTPDSSAPGTPGELDPDFVGNIGNMSMTNNQRFMQSQYQGFGGYGFGNRNEMVDLCIDEPAKRLFSLNGGFNNPQTTSSSSQLGDDQYSENSELARTIREQQRMAGVPEPQPDHGIPKPFHCPVIGCEKAYKNHNGLKYHKSVSLQ